MLRVWVSSGDDKRRSTNTTDACNTYDDDMMFESVIEFPDVYYTKKMERGRKQRYMFYCCYKKQIKNNTRVC